MLDFGDERRVNLRVVDAWSIEEETYPMLVEAEGTAPPQYPPDDDEE